MMSVERKSTFDICAKRAGDGESPASSIETKITLELGLRNVYVGPGNTPLRCLSGSKFLLAVS